MKNLTAWRNQYRKELVKRYMESNFFKVRGKLNEFIVKRGAWSFNQTFERCRICNSMVIVVGAWNCPTCADNGFAVVCCNCNMVQQRDGHFVSDPDAKHKEISHTVCPKCSL